MDAARGRAPEPGWDHYANGWGPAGDAGQDRQPDLAPEDDAEAGWDQDDQAGWSHQSDAPRGDATDAAHGHPAEEGWDHTAGAGRRDPANPGQGDLLEDVRDRSAEAGWEHGADAGWSAAPEPGQRGAADWARDPDDDWSDPAQPAADQALDADWDEAAEAGDHVTEAGWDRAAAGAAQDTDGWDHPGHAGGNHAGAAGPSHPAEAGWPQPRDAHRDQAGGAGRENTEDAAPGSAGRGSHDAGDRAPGVPAPSDRTHRRDFPSASGHAGQPAADPAPPEVTGSADAASGRDRTAVDVPAPITAGDVLAGTSQTGGVNAGAAGRIGRSDSIAAELAGWASGELPGQASARLAAWAAIGGVPAQSYRPASASGIGSPGIGTTEPVG